MFVFRLDPELILFSGGVTEGESGAYLLQRCSVSLIPLSLCAEHAVPQI